MDLDELFTSRTGWVCRCDRQTGPDQSRGRLVAEAKPPPFAPILTLMIKVLSTWVAWQIQWAMSLSPRRSVRGLKCSVHPPSSVRRSESRVVRKAGASLRNVDEVGGGQAFMHLKGLLC
ncbi:hypothetical protein CCHR01_03003 [Colletotrichum chrysophilum]|uniref:Uncharacterized protein n=1 Tax=Colletotrichum chrysophilum TaxID=1836956 RepID=A0AAD9AV65_9PEZI|nr:hypothetical protein CCHR01_03003 [Colletotrichum chrysophilum]